MWKSTFTKVSPWGGGGSATWQAGFPGSINDRKTRPKGGRDFIFSLLFMGALPLGRPAQLRTRGAPVFSGPCGIVYRPGEKDEASWRDLLQPGPRSPERVHSVWNGGWGTCPTSPHLPTWHAGACLQIRAPSLLGRTLHPYLEAVRAREQGLCFAMLGSWDFLWPSIPWTSTHECLGTVHPAETKRNLDILWRGRM